MKTIAKTVVAAGLIVSSLSLPITANAQFIYMGNIYGCNVFSQPIKMIGNRAASTTKVDCRYSATKSNIQVHVHKDQLTKNSPGNYNSRVNGGVSSTRTSNLFSQKTTFSFPCLSNRRTEYRSIVTSTIAYKNRDNGATGDLRNYQNWRTARTLPCS